MKKIFTLLVLTAIAGGSATAQFRLNCKIRAIGSVKVTLTNLNNDTLINGVVRSGEEFSSGILDIKEDLYMLSIGMIKRDVILGNSPIQIKGFVDAKNENTSNIQIIGSPQSDSLYNALGLFKNWGKGAWDWTKIENGFSPMVLTSVVVQNEQFFAQKYEILKLLNESYSYEVKKNLLSSRIREIFTTADNFKVGAKLTDFTLPDRNGVMHSTSQMRDKLILVDFWASWCGPCRKEMKSLQNIYEEIKGDDLVFISVSLDDDREKWIKAMDTDKIPWLALWDDRGFYNTPFQKQYGFSQIPFIILIGKDGKILARGLRGEDVKAEILKHRNKK